MNQRNSGREPQLAGGFARKAEFHRTTLAPVWVPGTLRPSARAWPVQWAESQCRDVGFSPRGHPQARRGSGVRRQRQSARASRRNWSRSDLPQVPHSTMTMRPRARVPCQESTAAPRSFRGSPHCRDPGLEPPSTRRLRNESLAGFVPETWRASSCPRPVTHTR